MNEVEKLILEKIQRIDDCATELRLIRESITGDRDGDYITEMAQINPKLNTSLDPPIYIWIRQRDEGNIPHLHVYHDRELKSKRCSFIRLDKAEYSPHHPIVPLPRKLQNSFLAVMTTVWPKEYVMEKDGNVRRATGYEAAVNTWIDTFGTTDGITFQQDEETGIWMMPPYDELFKFERK